MKIEGANIKLSRSSSFLLDGTDKVSGCRFTITDEKIGIDTPIVVDGHAAFTHNIVISELEYPIFQKSPTALVHCNILRRKRKSRVK